MLKWEEKQAGASVFKGSSAARRTRQAKWKNADRTRMSQMTIKLQVKSFESGHNFLDTLVAPGLMSFTKEFLGKTLLSASNAFLEEPSKFDGAVFVDRSTRSTKVEFLFKGCLDGMKPLKDSTSPVAWLCKPLYPSDKEDPTDAFLADVHPFASRYHTNGVSVHYTRSSSGSDIPHRYHRS